MPFFLFADSVLIVGTLMIWLTLEGFIFVPAKDAAMALILGVHGIFLLYALEKRNKIPFNWFSPTGMIKTVALGVGLLILAHLYLPMLLIPYWEETIVRTSFWGAGESPAIWSGLGWQYQIFLLFAWMIGGIGAVALSHGLLCLELERSGARQVAVYLGASGYTLMFAGESLYYLMLPDDGTWANELRAIVFLMDRWLIAFAAGYLFITTRHLAGSGILLGLHEWVVRYGVAEAQNALYQPLVLLEAGNQKEYWALRLLCASAALVAAILLYHRNKESALGSEQYEMTVPPSEPEVAKSGIVGVIR